VKGIALGTLIAEWIALLFGWYLLSRKLQIKHVWKSIKELWQQIIDKVQMIAMFKVNGDIMIRTFALLGGFAWFANEGAKFGDATLAANHVLLQFVSLSAFFLDGFANVIEMYAGTAIGKDDKSLFKQRIWETTKVSGVTAFLLGLGIILLAPSAISLLTQDQNVQVIAENHAIYAGIYIVLSFVAFQLDGVFIGATRSKEMRNATVLSFIVLIGLGTFTTHQFGNIGLWIAFIAFVIVRGLGLGLYLPKLMRTSFSGEVD
ncbi:MAG TPA: MATE family efflux transporter, partial [Flavobacteriaceae bacterium]|nr:MATE family efflux transporter [Flavobacteriaceae bacterium]